MMGAFGGLLVGLSVAGAIGGLAVALVRQQRSGGVYSPLTLGCAQTCVRFRLEVKWNIGYKKEVTDMCIDIDKYNLCETQKR